MNALLDFFWSICIYSLEVIIIITVRRTMLTWTELPVFTDYERIFARRNSSSFSKHYKRFYHSFSICFMEWKLAWLRYTHSLIFKHIVYIKRDINKLYRWWIELRGMNTAEMKISPAIIALYTSMYKNTHAKISKTSMTKQQVLFTENLWKKILVDSNMIYSFCVCRIKLHSIFPENKHEFPLSSFYFHFIFRWPCSPLRHKCTIRSTFWYCVLLLVCVYSTLQTVRDNKLVGMDIDSPLKRPSTPWKRKMRISTKHYPPHSISHFPK